MAFVTINHWARECPDQPHQSTSAYFNHTTTHPDVLGINYVTNDVTLFQSDVDGPTHLEGLVNESWNYAVLDSGASKTVCGMVWLNTYVACLNMNDKSRVSCSNSSGIFRFGYGRRVPATSTAHIPAFIGNQQLFIDTDVIDEDIPLLLSHPSMKKQICRSTLRMTWFSPESTYTLLCYQQWPLHSAFNKGYTAVAQGQQAIAVCPK